MATISSSRDISDFFIKKNSMVVSPFHQDSIFIVLFVKRIAGVIHSAWSYYTHFLEKSDCNLHTLYCNSHPVAVILS